MFMKKKIIFMSSVIIVFAIFSMRFYKLRFVDNAYYLDLYDKKSTRYVYGLTQERGKILDTNGNILVDNKRVNIITFRLINNPNTSYLIELAYKLINILDVSEEASTDELKKFFLLTENTDYLVTREDNDNLKYRYITYDDLETIKYNKITDEIKKYTLKDRIAIHLYYLMNEGYYYDTKILDDNVSDDVCQMVSNSNIVGLACSYRYTRSNEYASLDSIFGRVSTIRKEDYDKYKSLGYLDDELVGVSGLELYYEDTLHGTKDKYVLNKDNSLQLVEAGRKGEDITLNIDIILQKELESIQKDAMKQAITMKNTKYYNTTYAIVTDPNTGGILALSGLKYENDNFYDVSSNIMLTSYTVGSVIKGASNTVGYLNDAIDTGKYYKDACVKIYGVPKKCSYRSLGSLNDITALKYSSNYYQFLTAIRVSGNNYKYNMKLKVTSDDFDKYRSVFKKFGLGNATGIDFPKENLGITGSKISSDLYLNLAIGQYDTYTPLQLVSYINTIANRGKRYSLSFLQREATLIDEVGLEQDKMERIIKGFYEVIKGGTANNYIPLKYKGVGKTGTAQSYYDGKTTTINTSFAGFAPYDEPKYSYVILNPNISFENDDNRYNAPITRMISIKLANYLFAK